MTTVPLADARSRLSQLVEAAVSTHERTEITRNGLRAAVLVGAEDFDALMETLDILSDQDAVRDLRQALAEAAIGDVFSTDDVRAAMSAAGRLR